MSTRLDQLLVARGLFTSREKARRTIMAGRVRVLGRLVDKAGTKVATDVDLEVLGPKEPYVSRGGRKLAPALDYFGIVVSDMLCLDIGASTGGFTDCLLGRGAGRVYAVDVGYGQLDHGLRTDSRVVVMERVNARYLSQQDLPVRFDLIVVDVSFISLLKVVPALVPHLGSSGRLLTLVKPQFEAGRSQVGKGGVVRDEVVRSAVIRERVEQIQDLGLEALGCIDCAVSGAKGNREAFALFSRSE